MTFDSSAIFSKKTAAICTLGVVGILLIAVAVKIFSGNIGEASRRRYAEQRAGVGPRNINGETMAPIQGPKPLVMETTPSKSTLPPSPEGREDAKTLPTNPGLSDIPAKPQEDLTEALPQHHDEGTPPVPASLLEQQLPIEQGGQASTPVAARVEVAPERYLFNNQSPDATEGVTATWGASGDANINLKTFSPEGETIELATLSAASTRDSEIPVVAGVWKPFFFNNHKLLDVGDKLLGQAAAGKVQGRATVQFTKIIFKNGKSLSINALATDPAGNLGIPGNKVGDAVLSALGPVLLNVASAVTKSFEQSATQVTTSGGLPSVAGTLTGGLVGTTQSTTQNAAQSAKNAGINAGGAAMDKISQLLADDMDDNKPYLLVLPGTPCKALLMSPLDVSKAGYGQ